MIHFEAIFVYGPFTFKHPNIPYYSKEREKNKSEVIKDILCSTALENSNHWKPELVICTCVCVSYIFLSYCYFSSYERPKFHSFQMTKRRQSYRPTSHSFFTSSSGTSFLVLSWHPCSSQAAFWAWSLLKTFMWRIKYCSTNSSAFLNVCLPLVGAIFDCQYP